MEEWDKTVLVTPQIETWMYDGQDWTWIDTSSVTHPRVKYQIAFDPLRELIVLFGGLAGGAWDDTWEFDGTGWGEAAPEHSPPPTWNAVAAYFAPLDGIVLFGGSSPEQGDVQDTMWRYGP